MDAAKEVLRKRHEQPAFPIVKNGEGTKLVYEHPDQAVASCFAAIPGLATDSSRSSLT